MRLSERFEPLGAAWRVRPAREQVLLACLAVLAAGMIAWFAILAPALNWRAEAERHYSQAVEGYETLLVQLAQYHALANAVERSEDRESLRTLSDRLARERNLAISRVQPLEDGRLGVWMDTASADEAMGWLTVLSRDHGVYVDRISLDREQDGFVRIQLTLVRSGGA